MRKVFAVLALFCFGSIYSQFNDLENAELKGAVKKVESYKSNKLVKIVEYNTDGNITKLMEFHPKTGEKLIGFIKRYNDQKKQVYYEDQLFIDVTVFDDAANRRFEIRLNAKSKDTIQRTNTYFQNNNIVKTETFKFEKGGSKAIEIQKVFSYDAQNRLVKEIVTDYANIAVYLKPRVTETQYAYNGRQIRRTWQNNKGEWIVNENFQFPPKPNYEEIRMQRKMVYTYPDDKLTFDSAKKIYTRIHVHSSTLRQVTTYTEDARKISDEYYSYGKLITRTEFTYDSQNNLIETKVSEKTTGYILKNMITYY